MIGQKHFSPIVPRFKTERGLKSFPALIGNYFERPSEHENLLRASADLPIDAMVANCFDLGWCSRSVCVRDLDDSPGQSRTTQFDSLDAGSVASVRDRLRCGLFAKSWPTK